MTNEKILVVEDEAIIAMEISDRLIKLGYAVIAAAAGCDEAVELAFRTSPDLVLMDIRLRGFRDGIDAAAAIRDRCNIPVVFLSAHADAETVQRARATEPFGFLIKPYREEDLRLAVEIALIKHRTEQELRRAKADLERTVGERAAELQRTVEDLSREIETRNRMESELRASETKFRHFFEAANDGILIADIATGQFVEANPAMCAMLGYGRDELLARRIRDIHPRDAATRVLDEFRRAVESNKAIAEGLPLVRKNGDVFYCDVSHTTVIVGGVRRAMGIFRDITERKLTLDVMNLRLKLMDYAATHSTEDLLRKTLDEVGALTGSPIGFYHFVAPDGKTLSPQAWSTRTVREFCSIRGEELHASIEDAGVWRDCIFRRKPVIHNDYASLPHRRGMPAGHATVIRELVVPVIRENSVVAILGIGNKPRNYTQQDVERVAFLADISWELAARKRAEEALRKSNERHGTILRTAMDGYWLADRQGRLLEVNEAYCRMSGYTERELLSLRISDMEVLETAEDIAARMKRIAAQGEDRFESKHRRKDGRLFDVEISVKHLPIEDGRFIVFVRDITERKRTESALQESEARFRLAFDNAYNGACLTSIDGRFLKVNRRMCEMLGYRREQLEGMTVRDITHPDDVAQSYVHIAAAAACETYSLEINKRYLHADGHTVWVCISTALLRDARGEPLYFITHVQDITKRKEAEAEVDRYRVKLEEMVAARTGDMQKAVDQLHDEVEERRQLAEELQRSKLFLTNILNSIRDGICVLDENRQIMLVNNAVAQWVPEAERFGYCTHRSADLYGRLGRCDDCAGESGIRYGGASAALTTFRGSGQTDGKWFEVHSYPLCTDDGAAIGSVEYIRDVTRAKGLEEQITRYQERLRMLNYEMAALEKREKRRIAQELHDSIPQALAFCRMRLEGIEKRFFSSPAAAEPAEDFQEIYALLDKSIAEARSLIFQLAPPVLYELGLEPALQQLLHQLGKVHPIEFRFERRTRSAPIQGEIAAILYGMVRELLTNAVKHAAASTISLSVGRSDHDLVIEVRDDGRGFDQRSAAHSRQAGGGFGLFSIRERVRYLEGTFDIDTGEGGGACTAIRVPLSRLSKTCGEA